MGFLLKKKDVVSVSSVKTCKLGKAKIKSSASSLELYKPISDFDWKDATKTERKKTAIDAYKEFAF
jgi:hypothetical protein